MITALTAAVGAAAVAAFAYAIYKWLRPPPPPEVPPREQEPQPPTDDMLQEDREEQRRLREESRRAQEAARLEQERQRLAAEARLAHAVESLTDRLSFSSRREWVGRRRIGERVVGHVDTEGQVPDVGFIIRPIYDMSEVDSLLADEYAHDEDAFYMRLGLGESLVAMPIERHVIKEPIFDDVFREIVQVVYVLIDVSGSMFEERWRPPVWKEVLRRIVHKARDRSATMMLRPFSDRVLSLRQADASEMAYRRLLQFIEELSDSGGTKIGQAIDVALRDVTSQDFDRADIIIVSDGEDQNFNPIEVRARLDAAGIRLHAIMLGANNAGLRACADEYQIVEGSLKVHPPVIRAKKDP